MKIDNKTSKILYHLDANARQPLTKIAKSMNSSQERINYNIKQLEKKRIVTNYQLIVNLAKLGILQFKICLSFQNITSEKLLPIIKQINSIPEVKWIASCSGAWDLIISIETNSLHEIDSLKDKILAFFGNFVNKKSISIMINSEVYNRNYLLKEKVKTKQKRISMNLKQKKLLKRRQAKKIMEKLR